MIALLLSLCGPQESLQIEPATLVQWQEACRLVQESGDELWESYDLVSLPVLIASPGVEEVLIGHPSPPEGFARHDAPCVLEDVEVWVRRGETTIVEPFREFVQRKGVTAAALILAFMFLYKLGDNMATALQTAFYIDVGFSLTQIGSIAKFSSLIAAIVAVLFGGVVMIRASSFARSSFS